MSMPEVTQRVTLASGQSPSHSVTETGILSTVSTVGVGESNRRAGPMARRRRSEA